MEYSLRRSLNRPSMRRSLNRSFNGSSSFKRSPEDDNNNNNDDDDEEEEEEEEVHGEEHHPILSRRRENRSSSNPEISSSSPMSPSPGEVIVKIDPTPPSFAGILTTQHKSSSDSGSATTSQVGRDTPPSGEFSFRRPLDDVNREGNDDTISGCSIPDHPNTVVGEMSLDMDYDADEIRHQQDPTRRQQQQQQGLPPLPPEPVSRQSWSRNQSEVQSPDFSAYTSFKNKDHVNNNNNIHNGSAHTSNFDGSREIRVSFQESFNSEQVRRRQSIYSTVDGGSSSSSSAGDEDDDCGGSRIGRGGVQSRRASFRDRNSGEIIRCTSNNASLRRLPSMTGASRTRSRLADTPSTPQDQRSVPKSGPMNMRSGLLGKSSMLDEDEEDPFLDEDLPEEFRTAKIGTLMVLEWVSLVILVGALICSLIIPVLEIKTLWNMRLWKWEVLILMLICGRLVSDWGMRILVFFIERNFLLRKRLLYFVYGLKKAVQNVIWLGLVLLTWHFLFDKNVMADTKRSKPLVAVTRILIICEICALIWLVKTLLVKVCASTFHVTTFFDRIQEALFNQFVIETLSGPPLFDFQHSQDQEDFRGMDEVDLQVGVGLATPDCADGGLARTKSGKSLATPNGKIPGPNGTPYKSPIGHSIRYSGPISKKLDDQRITIDHLHKLNQKNVSAWNMKRLMRIVRHGSLTTLDEHIVDTTTHDDESATQIRNEVEAKAAARKIFRNVAQHRSRYIYIDDLLRFMREDEAMRTMSLFEGSAEADRISKSALRNWVVSVFRERRALALTLTDTKTAVNKLHKFVDIIVCIIILLMIAITINIISSKTLLFMSSQVVVAAFMFGNTCKNVFESIIFLFVIHPFDVGDRCEVDGVQMVVEEMNILTTVFLRYDNLKVVFPNYILLTKPINNYYRSPDMGDAVEFCVHIATPIEKITLMRQRILSYIENKKEHWYPNPMIILKDVENLQMLRIAVWLQHRMNHQDMGEKFVRRALLVEECVKIFRELDMDYRVYQGNVNTHSMSALNIPQIPFPNYYASTEGHREVVHP